MALKQVAAFDAKLLHLFAERTHWLKSLIRKRAPGALPKFSKAKVDKGILALQDHATHALLDSQLLPKWADVYEQKRQWHPKKNKGKGVSAKRVSFKAWYEDEIPYKNCVYVFWRKAKCIYVGRTLNGHGRPSAHFEKHWFSQVTRVDILAARQKGKIPMLECLVTHELKPTYSKVKPAKKKGFTKCPICAVHQSIRVELKQIFRLK